MAQIGRENDQRPQIGRMPIARRSSVPGWLRGLMLILVNSPLSRGLTRGFTTFWCLCYSQTQTKSAWRGILVPNPYPSIDSSIRSLFSSDCLLFYNQRMLVKFLLFFVNIIILINTQQQQQSSRYLNQQQPKSFDFNHSRAAIKVSSDSGGDSVPIRCGLLWLESLRYGHTWVWSKLAFFEHSTHSGFRCEIEEIWIWIWDRCEQKWSKRCRRILGSKEKWLQQTQCKILSRVAYPNDG